MMGEHERDATDPTARANDPADDGACARCWTVDRNTIVAELPIPENPGEEDCYCLDCWGELVADHTQLEKPEAFILGAHAAGAPGEYVRQNVILPKPDLNRSVRHVQEKVTTASHTDTSDLPSVVAELDGGMKPRY